MLCGLGLLDELLGRGRKSLVGLRFFWQDEGLWAKHKVTAPSSHYQIWCCCGFFLLKLG